MKSQFKVTVRCLTNAGDYDYEDSHELPAGCQYMDMQSSDNSEYSSDSHTAQPPRLADADNSSGHGSAPANAPGSAVAAAEAPVQAPAPSAYMGRVTISSVSPKHSAPTPAPDTAPRNATAPAQAAALSDASAGRPGQGNLLSLPLGPLALALPAHSSKRGRPIGHEQGYKDCHCSACTSFCSGAPHMLLWLIGVAVLDTPGLSSGCDHISWTCLWAPPTASGLSTQSLSQAEGSMGPSAGNTVMCRFGAVNTCLLLCKGETQQIVRYISSQTGFSP